MRAKKDVRRTGRNLSDFVRLVSDEFRFFFAFFFSRCLFCFLVLFFFFFLLLYFSFLFLSFTPFSGKNQPQKVFCLLPGLRVESASLPQDNSST